MHQGLGILDSRHHLHHVSGDEDNAYTIRTRQA
jgi:hypothetical protein